MRRFPLPPPAKRDRGLQAVVTLEPCYRLIEQQGSSVAIARTFVASAPLNPGAAGWDKDAVKELGSLPLEQLFTRISARQGDTRIYTLSVALLLWSTPLLGILAERGWRSEWLFDGGSTEILRISRGDSDRSVTLQSIHAIAPDYNDRPEATPMRRQRLTSANDSSATAVFYARAELDNLSRAVRDWIELCTTHSQVPVQGSIGAQAWTDWRATSQAQESVWVYLDADLRQYCRQAYFGGYCRAMQRGDFEGSYAMVDITSSYPHVMLRRTYPKDLHAWVYDLGFGDAVEWMHDGCIIADCELDTDEPIYPIRSFGRIAYPLGRVRTHLCTDSIRYALDRGHLVHIHSAQLWTGCRPFGDWVERWWGVRHWCGLNDLPRQRSMVKLMLNSLYGRLGMRVEKVVIEEECDPAEMRMEYGMVRLDDLDGDVRPAYASSGHVEIDGHQWVPYSDISCLGRRTVAVKGSEPPLSVPHLSAHVTDYARIALWRRLVKLGLENVLYCDTDSAIIASEHVPRSMRRKAAPNIGQWSVRLEGERLQIFGEKLYVLHDHSVASGLPRTAIPVGPHAYEAPRTAGLLSHIAGEPSPGVRVDRATYSLDPLKRLSEAGEGRVLT